MSRADSDQPVITVTVVLFFGTVSQVDNPPISFGTRRISTKATDGSNERRCKLLTDNELNLLESMQAGIEDESEDFIVNISFVHHNRRSKDGKVLPPKEGTVDERTLGEKSPMDQNTLQGSLSLDERTLGKDSPKDGNTNAKLWPLTKEKSTAFITTNNHHHQSFRIFRFHVCRRRSS